VMHVPTELARAASEQARTVSADLVVTIGGGSATGLAKAVALETKLPIMAIATTYAGSEMTPVWGLTDAANKTTGRDPIVQPKTVIYDPLLTVSLPVDVSAASGMNALAHLVEALYAPDASPLTALHAEEGVRVLAHALPRVIADPGDLDARTDALYGAWLAGTALGMSQMGLHHKICHVLGGAFDLPHAATHSAVLPHVVSYNRDAAPEAMARLAHALDVDDPACGIWELAGRIGAPRDLQQCGFREEHVEHSATLIVQGRPVNPRAADVEGVRAILTAASLDAPPAIRGELGWL
jgi:maleylacetate reductase